MSAERPYGSDHSASPNELNTETLFARQAERFPPSAEAIYLTLPEKSYTCLIYRPQGWTPADRRPAIVLFFGGGWRKGTPFQFSPFAAHFAALGYVVVLPWYRVRDRDGSTVPDAVKDARSALRWVKTNARELGVDPEAVIAGGGSAGGHLAASLAVIELDHEGDDLSIDPAPAGLVLFNPVADLCLHLERSVADPSLYGLATEDIARCDPSRHVGQGYPPSIIFHGTADRVVPFASVDRFAEKLKENGNDCTLCPFEEREHGFFNAIRGEADFRETIERTEAFLKRIGCWPDI